jgi:predicted ATPase/DNA-binding SARP family transcriptional activator
MPELFEVLLLGPVAVRDQRGGALAVGGRRERALLARLALAGGRVVAVERLIDDLFGESPPATARNALQVYVSHLRKRLDADAVRSTDAGYALGPPAAGVDVDRFGQLVDAGIRLRRTGSEKSAVDRLGDALDLWRGDPLADLSEYEFARTAAVGLGELRASAVEELAEAQLACGRHDEVVSLLMPLLVEYPFRERLRAAVMSALYRSGDRAQALAVYRDGRLILQEELGLDPGPALQALHAAILSDDPTLVAEAPHAAHALDAVSPPAPATPLLGRAGALADLSSLVDRRNVRLISVLGPGGAGKTRLALELATHPPSRYASATVWVSLVSLTDISQVLPAIGAALRLRGSELGVAQVTAALEGADILLILDNAEHLLPDLAGVVAALLTASPDLTVVATSRAALRLDGEHRFPLGPLPIPDPDGGLEDLMTNPAVDLFSQRARQAHPAFGLTAAVAPTIARICQRLDGLPLALELAAARTSLLDPAAMLARLESRLGLLTSGPRARAEEHGSLRATLDWSYRLLSHPAQRLFAELAVFRGGFTLDAAEAITRVRPAGVASCDDPGALPAVDALQELLDASLIVREPDGRMHMLETTLEYAIERLTDSGDDNRVRAAHCAYYRDQVRNRSDRIPPRPATAAELDWLTEEQENLWVATHWAAAHDDDALVDLATRTAAHWNDIGYWPDFEPMLEQATRHAAGVRGFDTEYSRAFGLGELGRINDAIAHADRALAHIAQHDHPERLALGVALRALLAHLAGDTGRAMELSETALRTAETTSNLDVRALVFMARAAALASHDPARSHRWVLHALEEATRAGNEHLVWQAYTNLAEIALTTGNSEEALYWCREVLRRDLLSKPIIRAYIVDIMAGALLLKGDLPQARTALREALRLVVNTSHFVAVEALLFFAALAAASGDLRAAAILLGRHDVMLQTLGSVRVDSSVRIYDQFLADLPDRLGASVYAAYRAQGEALTWQQVIDWLLHDHVPLSENPAAIPSWGTG